MSSDGATAPLRRPDVYLLSFGDHLPDPATGTTPSEGERIRSVVKQAVIAERYGFTGVAIGEHHFVRYVISCPMLLLAAIALQTSRIRLSTAVTLLATRDPVYVAEELATLDALSDGRAEIVVARGISRETNTAFGVQPDELRSRFEEHLRLLLRLLEETDVTWSGRYRAALDGVTTRPRPVPRRRPGVWIGTGSEASAALAAETRLPLMLPSTLRPPEGYRGLVELYRERLGSRGRVALPSHVFVAPTTAQAWRRWRPHLNAYAEFAAPWRGDVRMTDPGKQMQRAAVCGDPDTVAAGLNELGAVLGLDCHLVLMDVGGLSHPEVLEAIELFGEEVIPRLAASAVSGADPHHAPARLDGRGFAGRRRSLPFSTIEDAIDDIRRGRMVVVCDAADRENEGDLTLAAQFATPEAINFMATHGRGLICLALDPERCDELCLEPMASNNESRFATPFTMSIEAREGISTGISAYDRARTIQVAVDPATGPGDLVCPGHIFPLRARSNGVLERTGQTEAAVDLARLAGLMPAGVICEVMNDDGTMARVPDLEGYCATHGLKMVTIADLIDYRLNRSARSASS